MTVYFWVIKILCTTVGESFAGYVNVTLGFWLARTTPLPLGANLGDFLGSSRGDGGLGLGTFGTSILFLGAILVVVAYLTRTRKDQAEPASAHQRHSATYHGPSHDAYPRPSIGD